MKIAIFENEFEEMKSAFIGFNLLFYNKTLDFKVFQSSQVFGDFKQLKDYDYVLIDIDLSINSQLDGFEIISEILKDREIKMVKPIILTGQPPIKEKLIAKKLPNFPIINKPLVYTKIQEAFLAAKPLEAYR